MQRRSRLGKGFAVKKNILTSVEVRVCVWRGRPVVGFEGQVFSLWAKQLLACSARPAVN